MLPSVLFSLQLIKFNQKCTHTSTKGTKGLSYLDFLLFHIILVLKTIPAILITDICVGYNTCTVCCVAIG